MHPGDKLLKIKTEYISESDRHRQSEVGKKKTKKRDTVR